MKTFDAKNVIVTVDGRPLSPLKSFTHRPPGLDRPKRWCELSRVEKADVIRAVREGVRGSWLLPSGGFYRIKRRHISPTFIVDEGVQQAMGES